MICSTLPKNGRELREHSGYMPELKLMQSILKSSYVPSPPLMQQLVAPLKNLHHLPSPPNSKPRASVRKATSFFIPLNAEKSQFLKSQSENIYTT